MREPAAVGAADALVKRRDLLVPQIALQTDLEVALDSQTF